MEDLTGRFMGWIGYDADCALCVRLADWTRALLQRRGFRLVPLQTPWMRARLGLKAGDTCDEMKLLTPDGRVFGGADAAVELGRTVCLLRPLLWITAVSGGKWLLKWGYRWIARHRRCAVGFCQDPRALMIGDKNTL